ncbi:MAG: signal peptidase I [Candidatus Zixiibacteriota bacterium]
MGKASVHKSRPDRSAYTPPKSSFTRVLWEYGKSLGIALILAWVIKTSVVEAYKIPSSSMEDTLLVGDFLLANKFIYGARLPLIDVQLPEIRDPEPGDVVIFKYPKDPSVNYIKRCIAVGGQKVEIRNKVVYVDNEMVPLPEHGKFTSGNRFLTAAQGPRDNFGPYVVPEGHYFMLGDNRDNSQDSRYWGFVPRDLVMGKAMVIHWSWGTDSNAPHWSWGDPVSVLNAVVYNAAHFVDRVRWNRLGQVIR